MEREDKDKINIDERIKKYGKVSSTWYCSAKCGHEINSFLFNFEYHVPEMCPQCNTGWMFEDESKRVQPFKMKIGGGKQEEDRRFNQLPLLKQAEILSDDSQSGGYY